MLRSLLALSLLAPTAALAECPPALDIDAEEARVLDALRTAEDGTQARVLSNELWSLWASAPDEVAQEMLDRGMSARSSYDFLGALDALNRLVDYCPHYAEGYNQRAFVNYLREDFAAALVDLDAALELRPTHVAALSGKALTLMGLGRQAEAQLVLRDALELNPWLPERGLLRPLPGEDL